MEQIILDQAATLYETTASQLRPLSGGHFSSVYGFNRRGTELVLRITPPNNEVDLPSMQSILHWMDYLAKNGATVSQPIQSSQGRLIEIIQSGKESYLASVVTAAQGVRAETLPIETWNDRLLTSLGECIGRVHSLTNNYLPPSDLPPRPEYLQAKIYPTADLPKEPWVADFLQKAQIARKTLIELPRTKDDFGLIHADLHFGNMFVDPESSAITIFDFDDSAYGWYVMDLAMLVFDALVLYNGNDAEGFAAFFWQNLLAGYRRATTISSFWLGQVPTILKFIEVDGFLRYYKDYRPEDNGWLKKFFTGHRERIEGDLPYVNIDFVIHTPGGCDETLPVLE